MMMKRFAQRHLCHRQQLSQLSASVSASLSSGAPSISPLYKSINPSADMHTMISPSRRSRTSSSKIPTVVPVYLRALSPTSAQSRSCTHRASSTSSSSLSSPTAPTASFSSPASTPAAHLSALDGWLNHHLLDSVEPQLEQLEEVK